MTPTRFGISGWVIAVALASLLGGCEKVRTKNSAGSSKLLDEARQNGQTGSSKVYRFSDLDRPLASFSGGWRMRELGLRSGFALRGA